MRVIAGIYRSRPLVAPKGTGTRPTSDRLRETLFNVLAPRIVGSRFVDLYAGTGAVGIEAMSRRAEHVWFAEKAAPAIAAMRTNLTALKIAGGYTLETRGVGALLPKLVGADLVFLDPPYEAVEEYERTMSVLGSGRGLADGAMVIAEHGRKVELRERYGVLVRSRVLVQGDAGLSFFAVEKAGSVGLGDI
jgi:16S rRNA (guanine966-N2)-methyltransferase